MTAKKEEAGAILFEFVQAQMPSYVVQNRYWVDQPAEVKGEFDEAVKRIATAYNAAHKARAKKPKAKAAE